MRLTALGSVLAFALVATPSALSAQATQASAPRPKPAQLPSDSMELARKFTTWLYVNQTDSLLAHSDSASRAQPEARAQLEGRSVMVAERGGNEVKVIDEKFVTRNGVRQYWRTATFSNMNEPLMVRWAMNAKGEIVGLGLNPASQAPPIDP